MGQLDRVLVSCYLYCTERREMFDDAGPVFGLELIRLSDCGVEEGTLWTCMEAGENVFFNNLRS